MTGYNSAQSVRHVRHACVMLCAINSLKINAVRHVRHPARVCVRTHARMRMRMYTRTEHMTHMTHMTHISCTSSTYVHTYDAHHDAHDARTRARLVSSSLFKKEKVMETEAEHRRVIRATPENAAQMRQVVQSWPELMQLVRDLQAADLFPGLRNMTVTLYGSREWVQQGLDGVVALCEQQENA